MEIKGRIAVITGGASGIGKSFAERLHADGAKHIVVVDRDEAGAKAVADAINGTAAAVDVSDEAAVRKIVAETITAFGKIDVLAGDAALFVPSRQS